MQVLTERMQVGVRGTHRVKRTEREKGKGKRKKKNKKTRIFFIVNTKGFEYKGRYEATPLSSQTEK